MAEDTVNGKMNADEAVVSDYRDYGLHTVATKLPHVIDGLKPIQKRILWTIYHRNPGKHKATVLGGDVLEKYHVSGDSSVNEAISHLCQPFNFIVPLLYAETNVGDYGGGKPAQPRYLEVQEHKFTRAVYFDNTELGTLNMVTSDTETTKEPDYLIPALPMALITGGFGMSIGFKTSPTTLNLDALCRLTVAYVNLYNKFGFRPPAKELNEQLGHFLIPDTPTDGLLRNEAELLEAYRSGDFKCSIVQDGAMEVTPKSIILRTLPYFKNFSQAEKNVGKMIVDKKENFVNLNIDGITNASKGCMDSRVEFTLKRGVSPWDVIEPLKKLIEFTGRYTPCNRFFTKERKCPELSPFDVLDMWYQERKRSVLAGFKNTQRHLTIAMRRFEAILMAHTDMDAVFQIFKNAKKPEDTIQPLIERFGMTQFQAKYLSEITLGSITNINVEKLKLDLERIHTESVEVQKKMFMIDAVICEAAENIRKKFGGEFGHRRSAVPSFIGCATIGQGRIQFNSLTEADMIISRFGIDTDIRLYPNGVKNKVRHHDDGLDDESELSFPKEFVTKHFQVSNRKHKFTVGIRKNPTTIFAVKGLHYRDEPDVKYVHVSEQFLTIDKDGCLKILTPNDLAVRKSADSTGILSDIENVYPIVSNEVYIAYINSNEKNVVRVVKLETSGRLRRSPLGETTILTVWKPGEDSIISVPESHLNRISIAHVLIHSSETAGSIIIDLSKRSSSDGRSLSKYGTHLMHLK